jgi:hypothetical protein
VWDCQCYQPLYFKNRKEGIRVNKIFIDGKNTPMLLIALYVAGTFAFALACMAVLIRRKLE